MSVIDGVGKLAGDGSGSYDIWGPQPCVLLITTKSYPCPVPISTAVHPDSSPWRDCTNLDHLNTTVSPGRLSIYTAIYHTVLFSFIFL